MTMKLIQKRFLKETREFEIIDDAVYVRIKGLLKGEKLTVGLSTLDPEPAVNGSELEFFNKYKGRPVLSLLLDKPNAEEFKAFIDTLKTKIAGEDDTSASLESDISENTRAEALARNMHEEPPEFAEPGKSQEKEPFQPVIPERLAEDIGMLKTYLDENDIKSLLESLETLKAEPGNEVAFKKMLDAFNELGFEQGAVLTYAHYLKVLVSKHVSDRGLE